MSALGDEILAALESPRGRALLRATVIDAVREIISGELRTAISDALDQRDGDAVGSLAALASWLGCATPDAARKRVERDPELAALAFNVGRIRKWRKSEVVGLLARRRGGGK